MSDLKQLVKDVVSSPLGDVIASVAHGVAEAQADLDEGALAKTLEIYSEGGEELLNVLKEIGYMPTFYSIPETVGEMKVDLKLSAEASRKVAQSNAGNNTATGKPRLYATPIDAGYMNRYNHQANISASLKFKIVPVPPPAGADELRVLPNLVGANVAEAKRRLAIIGINAIFQDDTGVELLEPGGSLKVIFQIPEYNESSANIIRIGDEVLLTLE